jgi:hypothetical protein
MNRLKAALVGLVGVVVAGCGVANYEARLQTHLSNLRYQQKLETHLQPAMEGNFKSSNIYLRPPKQMAKAATPLLDVAQGQFDLADSFDGDPTATPQPGSEPVVGAPKLALHVLARIKKAKTPTKGAQPEPAAAPAAPAGDFVEAVRGVLAARYGPGATTAPIKKGQKERSNAYDFLTFVGNGGNTIQVYILKQNEFDVAQVWEIPDALKAKALGRDSALKLSLGAFAVGRRATTLFETGGLEEESPVSGGAATF